MCTRQEAAISPVGTVEYMAPEVRKLAAVDMCCVNDVPSQGLQSTAMPDASLNPSALMSGDRSAARGCRGERPSPGE